MEEEIGRIGHYFSRIGVAVLDLTLGDVVIGDTLHIQGKTTDFYQNVRSLQIEHRAVAAAGKGIQVGIRLDHPARENDRVYKVMAD